MVSSYRELLFRAIMMISSLFFSVSILQAQDEFDALRYSQVGIGGTARTWGLGGAAGSMGGDFSSLSVNPAGIGIYRSSEMMMTPDLLISKNANTYLGNEEFDHSSKFNFTNFGLVFCNTGNGRYRLRKGWKSVGIGLGMNRLASFKNESYYAGLNTKNSLGRIKCDNDQSGKRSSVWSLFGLSGKSGSGSRFQYGCFCRPLFAGNLSNQTGF